MPKEKEAVVKLNIPAGKATPAPPIGPALGQYGVSLMDFCKEYNKRTQDMGDVVVPAVITIYKDRSFDFVVKTPPASELLKKAAGIEKGSGEPHKEKVGTVTRSQLKEIAERKMKDLSARDLESAAKIIEGTAKQMGLEIVEK
ncbi:MAG: 50S ribosomal protein L11 [Patescibacteria group bacterium]|nr:50S ribosomal protein L11 [Patescibacteria group bacterium]